MRRRTVHKVKVNLSQSRMRIPPAPYVKACAVSTWDFLLGTAVGLAPGTSMLSWVGWSLREYSARGAGPEGHAEGDARQLWGTLGLTLFSGLLLGWRVNRIIKSTAAAVSASGAKASSKTVRGGALA